MKKSIAAIVAVLLVAGAFAAPATAARKKKPKKATRVAESSYQAPAIGSGAGVCLAATNSCGDMPTASTELYVMIEITDQSGLDVFATVGQDLDGDSLTDTSVEVCGRSEEPLPIEPGVPLTIFPWAIGNPGCPGVATQGTVKATFSNLP